MEKYFEVEVTRTVTERRKIYVSAENGDTAHDAALGSVELVVEHKVLESDE